MKFFKDFQRLQPGKRGKFFWGSPLIFRVPLQNEAYNKMGLMRNTNVENIQEHSLQVAMIAHGLAVISNTCFEITSMPNGLHFWLYITIQMKQ